MNPERREPQEKKIIETVGLPITAEEAPDFILKELLKRRILAEGEQPEYKIFFRIFDKSLAYAAASRGVDRSTGSEVHYDKTKALKEAGLKPEDIAYAGTYNNLIVGKNSFLAREYKTGKVAIIVYDANKLTSVRGIPHSITPKTGQTFKDACLLIFAQK